MEAEQLSGCCPKTIKNGSPYIHHETGCSGSSTALILGIQFGDCTVVGRKEL